MPWCLWPIVGCEGRSESRSQTRKPRRWQPTPSREAEGTPNGFGEAIHCWAAQERWPYCWTRSLSVCERTLRYPWLSVPIWPSVILFSCARILSLMVIYLFTVKHLLLSLSFSAFAEIWILYVILTVESESLSCMKIVCLCSCLHCLAPCLLFGFFFSLLLHLVYEFRSVLCYDTHG